MADKTLLKGHLQEIATARTSKPYPDGINGSVNQRFHSILPRWFLFPNLLALDAALFSVCWQTMTGHAFGVTGHWSHPILLAAAVWLGYTADRLLDVGAMTGSPHTLRHQFAARHRRGLLLAWITILGLSVFAACLTLSGKELKVGFALAAICMANASANHLDSIKRLPIPKELRAALLLSSGIHLFAWTQLEEMGYGFGISFAAVTILCFLNCCFVAKWETRIDLAHGQSSLALRHEELTTKAFPGALAIAAICSIIAMLWTEATFSLMLQATAVALLALPILDRSCLTPEDKRALADASLFLPYLLIV